VVWPVIVVGSATHNPEYKFLELKAEWKGLEHSLHPEPGSDPREKAMKYGQQRYGVSKLAQVGFI
jgi:hypothetical protein